MILDGSKFSLGAVFFYKVTLVEPVDLWYNTG